MFSVCDRNISNKSNVGIFLFGIFLGLIACLNVVGISDGNVYAKSLSKTLVKTNSTSQRSAQSFAYDSDKDKIVVFLIESNAIQVLNSKTFKVESTHSSKHGHNNGAAYNPKFKTMVVGPCNWAVSSTFWVYDGSSNYSYKGKISASGGGGTTGYSRQKDALIGGGKGSFKIMKCSSATKCKIEDRFKLSGKGTYWQDGEAYGKYFYFAKSDTGGPSYIIKYDLDTKKKIETYELGSGELESITFIGSDVYLLYHHSGGYSYHIYKLTDESAKELLSGAGSDAYNGSTGSDEINLTTQGSVNPESFDEKYKKVKTVKVKKYKAPDIQAKPVNQEDDCSAILPDAWCNGGKDSVMNVLDLALTVITAGVGIVGLLGIVISGLQYAAAGDSEEMVAKSKRRIAAIVVGMALWVFLYVIMRTFLLGEI